MSRHCQSGHRSARAGTRSVGRNTPHVIGIVVSVLSRTFTRLAKCEIEGVDEISFLQCASAGFAFRARSRIRTHATNIGMRVRTNPAIQRGRSSDRHSTGLDSSITSGSVRRAGVDLAASSMTAGASDSTALSSDDAGVVAGAAGNATGSGALCCTTIGAGAVSYTHLTLPTSDLV